jgi:chorismate mutase
MSTVPEPALAGEPSIEHLREQIEQVDRTLLAAVARRVQLARHIGQLKSAAGIPTLDPAREAAVVRAAAAAARDSKLDEEEVRALYWTLIGLCRRAQQG